MKNKIFFVKIKLRRDPISEKSVLNEFKTVMFNNGNPDQFLLFVRYLNMTLKVSGTLNTVVKIQYLCTIVRVESLYQF